MKEQTTKHTTYKKLQEKLTGAYHSNKKCCFQIPTGFTASSGCQERKPSAHKYWHKM